MGIASYFEARDLLNIGYLAPMDRIARDIAGDSSPADTMVLVDGPNLSGVVLAYYLPGFSTRLIYTAEDAQAARREIANPAIRHVWFLRNPHDVTPGHVLEQLETALRTVTRVAGAAPSLRVFFAHAQDSDARREGAGCFRLDVRRVGIPQA